MEKSVIFISLGCDKNLVDSEIMLGELAQGGYSFTDDIDEAECAVINTCCFIGDAKEESIDTILEIAERKNAGDIRFIVVTGCLSQRYISEIQEEIPEVDALIGTASIGKIRECLDDLYAGAEMSVFCDPLDTPPYSSRHRAHSSGLFYAYLKIAEGCDKHCTYCIIPSLRGPYRSYPMEHLVEEAERLAEAGVNELILVAQETTLYGTDLYGHKALPELIRRLSGIDGIHWIRIQYCYPEEIDDALIEEMASNPKLCHYLDMPVQHASDAVLKRMGRRTSEEELRTIVGRLRERIPDIVLRTTLISGFPGETEEDHQELYRFVNEIEFDRLGVFTYSQEEGTPAGEMDDQIPEEIKKLRRDELMELQQAICFDNADRRIGEIMEVVIEGCIPEEDVYVGRTYADAPEVDGRVFIPADRERMSGEYAHVRITEARDYDLIGEFIDEPAQ
ncbi:MAG: 30S ribosomal protein S12 methylthiotransferase RimO [Lachnospiraceae bacterium]|nr:30S ribosomal protein S12 methylthiotransferase RimO [Lachnospiraceae bacterium]